MASSYAMTTPDGETVVRVVIHSETTGEILYDSHPGAGGILRVREEENGALRYDWVDAND